jgi:hypothetical protein
MKRLIAIFALLSGSLWAQSSPALDVPAASSKSNGPSYSQLYCAGFITHQGLPRTNFVAASKEAPHEDQFSAGSILFLGGPGLAEGERYSLIRQVEDPDREDSSPLQRKRLGQLGKLYQEIGWVTVHSVQKGAAVASFDFACDTAVPGDIVVPFHEKPMVTFHTSDRPVNSFLPASGEPTGYILGSKDFIGLLGSGAIVYTDFGAAKGAHPGDYLFIRRGYADANLNKIDRASVDLPKGYEPNAVHQAQLNANADAHFPSHVLGEMLVLSVSNESATALITRSFAEIQLGDVVQSEDRQAAVSEAERTVVAPHPCSIVSRARRVLFLGHGCGGK